MNTYSKNISKMVDYLSIIADQECHGDDDEEYCESHQPCSRNICIARYAINNAHDILAWTINRIKEKRNGEVE